MKTPAELAARLRKMVLAAQHHYSPTGEPLRSIVVTPEWLEDMADAANALDAAPMAAAGTELARFLALADAAGFKSIYDVPGLIDALRAAAPAAPVAQGEPFGWAIVHADGSTADFRPRIVDFFGCIQQNESVTNDEVTRFDRDWPGLSPHKLIPLYAATQPTLAELTQKFGELPEVSGKVVSVNKI